jgi:drug/metabolite transporter (DMT)-like permease
MERRILCKEQGGAWRMVAAMGLSGTIGVFVLLSGQTPQTVVLFRCLLGAAALFGWLAWTGGYKAFDRRALAWVGAGRGGAGGQLAGLFSAFSAERHLGGHRGLPHAALLPDPAGGAGPARTAGLAQAALAGAGLCRRGADRRHRLRRCSARALAGVLLALLAALLYALATLATRKLAAYAPAQIAGAQLVLGALAMAPLAQFRWGNSACANGAACC